MPHYRVTLTPLGPLGTKLVSGTLWGHLAWAIRYVDGEEALLAWLADQEERPWLFSSSMPAGMIPRPLLKPALRTREFLTLEEMRKEKKVRKEKFISQTLFAGMRAHLNEPALEQQLKDKYQEEATCKTPQHHRLKPHNSIDRLTGTTLETGGLYFEDVEFFGSNIAFQIFVFTWEPCLERLKALFDYVSENGFGSNASTGNGQFRSDIVEETTLFACSGNRAMSLSHGVLSENMHQVRYKQHVHLGKLGGHYARGGFSPFKYPILMMSPGATFTPADDGPFGKMLHHVHHDPDLASLRHHALHLSLSFTEVES